MSTPAPHTMTTEELLRFHPDNPLAGALLEAREQLDQAALALTAARSLQEAADQCAGLLEQPDVATVFTTLPDKLQALNEASLAFGEADDGELGG